MVVYILESKRFKMIEYLNSKKIIIQWKKKKWLSAQVYSKQENVWKRLVIIKTEFSPKKIYHRIFFITIETNA